MPYGRGELVWHFEGPVCGVSNLLRRCESGSVGEEQEVGRDLRGLRSGTFWVLFGTF